MLLRSEATINNILVELLTKIFTYQHKTLPLNNNDKNIVFSPPRTGF